MRSRLATRTFFGTFLLSTSALVSPAAAQLFDNQVNATALISVNAGNVAATATFQGTQSIAAGIGNSIGASATGALGIASVNQSISQSQLQVGNNFQDGNSIVVGTISATNVTTPIDPVANPGISNVQATVFIGGAAEIGAPDPNFPNSPVLTGGGINNTIGATATGAAASASIVQSFDSNGGGAVQNPNLPQQPVPIQLGALAPNSIQTGDIVALNVLGTVTATTFPNFAATIADGIGNAITAQASGAVAGASINSRMFQTNNTVGPLPAQGIASNTIQTGNIFAANNDAVTARFGSSQPSGAMSTIRNGIGNAIGAFATGASANANISQSIYFTTPLGGPIVSPSAVYANVVETGALAAINGPTGTVTASLGGTFPNMSVTQALIAYGIGNSIAAQATGARASGSIAQLYGNISANGSAGYGVDQNGNPFGASNNLTTGAMGALNYGDINATAVPNPDVFNGQPVYSSLISSGIGNFIGATAVGASTGLNVTQSFANATILQTTGVNNTATLNGAGMLSVNGAGAAIQATFLESYTTRIDNGAGNSIGASAVGASSGATINQSVLSNPAFTTIDTTSIGSNAVVVNAGVGALHAMAARTEAGSSVLSTFTQNSGQPTFIVDGVSNSIAAQAAGATVNAGITQRVANTSLTAAAVGQVAPPIATNSVNTTAGAVTDLHAQNGGTATAFYGPQLPDQPAMGINQIMGGVGNSIGASAVGAAASATITQSYSFDPLPAQQLTFASLTSLPSNAVTTGNIQAVNTGAVTATIQPTGQVTIGQNFNQFGVPGVANSISAQAVGATANASVSSRFYNVTAIEPQAARATNTIVTANLVGENTGTVQAFYNGNVSAATITGGIGNFIGATATGASAGAGIAQSVSGNLSLPFDMKSLPVNSVTAANVVATNAGQVTATLNSGVFAVGDFNNYPGSIGNSVSAQAVGASAGASIGTQVHNSALAASVSAAPQSTNSVTVASLTSINTGPVTATAAVVVASQQPAINGGIANSIGASATGASSIASINQAISTSTGVTSVMQAQLTTIPLNTVAVNTINSGPISALNSGNITASLSTTGNTFGAPTIRGGVGNSIMATAVGASAGASISQSIANVR